MAWSFSYNLTADDDGYMYNNRERHSDDWWDNYFDEHDEYDEYDEEDE